MRRGMFSTFPPYVSTAIFQPLACIGYLGSLLSPAILPLASAWIASPAKFVAQRAVLAFDGNANHLEGNGRLTDAKAISFRQRAQYAAIEDSRDGWVALSHHHFKNAISAIDH